MSDLPSAEKELPMKYEATHTSAFDGSDAMLVSQDAETITLINEDGYEWTEPRAHWCPIPPEGSTDG